MPHPQAPTSRYRLLTADDHAVLLADNSKRPATKVKTVVLNFVGAFENPWERDPALEAKRIEAFDWHPATDSWRALFGGSSTIRVESLSKFLGAIKDQQPHTIERVNLFSHGNPGLIAFSGSIDVKTGNVMLNTSTALDLRIKDTEPIPLGNGREQESLGTVARKLQDRFTDKAEIVLFLCNSGNDPELLQAVADTFHVVVKGFGHQVWVCPEWDKVPGPPRINRGFASMDKCKTKQRGFSHLVPDRPATPK